LNIGSACSGRAAPSSLCSGDEDDRLEPAGYHGAGYGDFGSNPALRRVRYGQPAWTCERALPLATPVDESMTWSDIRQNGFTLRPGNRGKPTSSRLFGESEIMDKAPA